MPFKSAFTKAWSLNSCSLNVVVEVVPVMKHLARISQHPVQQYISRTLSTNFSKISLAKPPSKKSSIFSLGALRSHVSLVKIWSSKMIALALSYGCELSKVVTIAAQTSDLKQE